MRPPESAGVLYSQLRYTLSETSLYCGFENAVEIFDVARPGEAGFRMQTTPTRSSRSGQKGKPARLFLIAESYVGRSIFDARTLQGSSPRSRFRLMTRRAGPHFSPRGLSPARSGCTTLRCKDHSSTSCFRHRKVASPRCDPGTVSRIRRRVLTHATPRPNRSSSSIPCPPISSLSLLDSLHTWTYGICATPRNEVAAGAWLVKAVRTSDSVSPSSSTRGPSGSVMPSAHASLSDRTGFDIDPSGMWLAAGDQVRSANSDLRPLLRLLILTRPALHRTVSSRSLAHSPYQINLSQSQLSPSRKVCIAFTRKTPSVLAVLSDPEFH